MKTAAFTKMRLTRTARSERFLPKNERVHVGAVVGESLISFGVAIGPDAIFFG